jgi:protein-tyrosine phosphatase
MKVNPYWIRGPWTGRLAILPRPRGGDWLEDEIRSWQRAGIQAVVSLLTPDEAAELSLESEAVLCKAHGITFLSFPIPDRSVPTSREATVELVRSIEKLLTEGKHVGLHCRQGLGRSAVISACQLMASGISTGEAFQRVGAARGCDVPETSEQREWVESLASELLATNVHTEDDIL